MNEKTTVAHREGRVTLHCGTPKIDCCTEGLQDWVKVKVLAAQSPPTLCDAMDCSPRGSSVHGILQARILEEVAIAFSRGSSQPRDRTHVSYISCIGRQILYY